MSKAEILSELPKLKPEERREVLESLWDLEERDLLNGIGPSADEKALLDREHDDFGRRTIPRQKHAKIGEQIRPEEQLLLRATSE